MENLINKKYGRLTVKRFHSYSERGHCSIWECLCDCGKITIVRSGNLKTGHTFSCGCFQEETRGKHAIIHGHTIGRKGTRTYNIWASIKARCNNRRNDNYKYYGGEGVAYCKSWDKFKNFLNDMGEAPEGMEIDRKNNELGYSKDNCRWVTKIENMRNKKCAIWEFNNKKYTISELAEINNVPYHALLRRLRSWGMDVNEALEESRKIRKRGVNKNHG